MGAGLLLVKPNKPFGIALAGSIIEAITIAYALGSGETSALQFSQPWLPEFGISFTLWIDGINGVLIGLTGLLIPFIVASTTNSDKSENASYLGLILSMQSALLGAFLAKDAFLFYFFFELFTCKFNT